MIIKSFFKTSIEVDNTDVITSLVPNPKPSSKHVTKDPQTLKNWSQTKEKPHHENRIPVRPPRPSQNLVNNSRKKFYSRKYKKPLFQHDFRDNAEAFEESSSQTSPRREKLAEMLENSSVSNSQCNFGKSSSLISHLDKLAMSGQPGNKLFKENSVNGKLAGQSEPRVLNAIAANKDIKFTDSVDTSIFPLPLTLQSKRQLKLKNGKVRPLFIKTTIGISNITTRYCAVNGSTDGSSPLFLPSPRRSHVRASSAPKLTYRIINKDLPKLPSLDDQSPLIRKFSNLRKNASNGSNIAGVTPLQVASTTENVLSSSATLNFGFSSKSNEVSKKRQHQNFIKKKSQKSKSIQGYELNVVKADMVTWGLLEISESPITYQPIQPPLPLKPTHHVTETTAPVKKNPGYVIPMLEASTNHHPLIQPASESVVSSRFRQLPPLPQEKDGLATLRVTPGLNLT